MADASWLQFVYTHTFERTAKKLLSEEDIRSVELELLENPRRGTVEAGTGGVRKMRVGVGGSGKRGGARVVYLFDDARATIYLLAAWPKTKKATLTSDDRTMLKALVDRLKE